MAAFGDKKQPSHALPVCALNQAFPIVLSRIPYISSQI